MLRFCLLIAFGVSVLLFFCNGKDGLRDSAERASNYPVDIGQYEALHRLAVELAATDNTKALDYATRAEEAALALGDTLSIRKAKRLKGQILLRLGRPVEALSSIQLYAKHKRWFREDDEQLVLLNATGVAYLMMGHFDQALEYYLQVSDLAMKLRSSEYERISLKNIGVTYYKLKAYDKGLAYLLRAQELEMDEAEVDLFTLINISLCYSHLGKFRDARQFLDESIQACGSQCGPRPSTHIRYAAGCLYDKMGKSFEARQEFTHSLTLARKTNDHRMMLDNIYMLAKMSIKTKQYRDAERHLNEGERIIHSGTPFNIEIVKVYEQLSSLYLQIRDVDRAFDYQSKYVKYRDSLYNEVVITHLMELESEYMEKENRAKIAEQQKLLVMGDEVLRHQRAINLLSLAAILLSVVIIVILFNNYQRKKSLNARLDQKVRERTAQLELSRRKLYEELRIQELSFKRLSVRVAEKLGTIKGLCQASRAEMRNIMVHKYLDDIERTFGDILSLLKSQSQP